MKEFVNIDDVCDVLLSYIGTEDFDRATSMLSSEAKSSFMSGIGMAGILIMSKCNKYIFQQPDADDDTQTPVDKEEKIR